jgi:hypothetical protein
MTEIIGGESNTGRIVLDWQAYFYQFVEVHGPPIFLYDEDQSEVATELLFQDGWRYSAIDYQGPERPPPEDPRRLTSLKIRYWTEREATLRNEVNTMAGNMKALESWDETRSLPLQQRVIYQSQDELGRTKTVKGEVEDIDTSILHHRLEDKENQLRVAMGTLRTLKSTAERLNKQFKRGEDHE